jgi:hypothetical protein
MTKGDLSLTPLSVTEGCRDKILLAKQKRSLRVDKLISVRQKRQTRQRSRSNSIGTSGSNSGSDSPKSTTSSSASSFTFSASEVRKHERKIRNRQSAMNSRLKIRAEVDVLKEKISKYIIPK